MVTAGPGESDAAVGTPEPEPEAGPAPGPSRMERLRRLGPDALRWLERVRPRYSAVDAGLELWDRDRSKAATLLAGALVYRMFVWLLPVALLITSLLGFLDDAGESSPEDVARSVGVGGYLVSVVGTAADQAESSRWFTLILALVGMALAGSGAVRALRLSHALVWEQELPRLKRRWVGPLALLGVTVACVVLAWASWKARAASPGLGLGAVLVTSLGFAALWLVASWLLPHADAPWWALVPGALLGAAGVLAMHLVTVYYLAGKIESASEMYGSLGAAAAVLLWLSIFARLVIVGAGLNATLWQRRARRRSGGSHPGDITRGG